MLPKSDIENRIYQRRNMYAFVNLRYIAFICLLEVLYLFVGTDVTTVLYC